MRRWLPALVLVACQPGPPTDEPGLACGERPDTVVARRVVCADDVPPGGEGVVGDYLLAGPDLRVIVRNEHGALTTLGVGGGTVIDAAPWGAPDVVHELIPLFDDTWLRDVSVELVDDGIRVGGTTTELLELQGAGPTGLARDITWRLDGAELAANGADALLVRASHALRHEGSRLAGDSVSLGTAGTPIDGVPARVAQDWLWVAAPADVLTLANPQGRRLSGDAGRAERLELYDDAGERPVAVVAVNGRFDLRVSAGVQDVVAVIDGRATSPRTPVGTNLQLDVGPTGSVVLDPIWSGRDHVVRASWDVDGRAGGGTFEPRGDPLPTGPGRGIVRVFEARSESFVEVEVDVPSGGTVTIEPELDGLTSPRVDIVWGAAGERADGLERLTDDAALGAAAATGAGVVGLVGGNRVSEAPQIDGRFAPHVLNGARLDLRGGGELVVWPLGSNRRREGYGAPLVADLPLSDAIAAAGGDRRQVVVDLEQLDVLGVPWSTSPRPTHVALGPPGIPGPVVAWAPLWRWIDAGVPIIPLGDRVLVGVPDADSASGTDLEAALVRGRVMASSGGEIWLTVGEAGPGEVVPDPIGASASPELIGDWREQARAMLVVDGTPHATWRAVDPIGEVALPDDARWTALVVWEPSADEAAVWATTAPIWLRPPPAE